MKKQDKIFAQENIKKQIQFFSYFDILSATKFFLVGTYNCQDEDNFLEKTNDLDLIGFKKGVKIESIEIYYFENIVIGYEITYVDFLNKRFTYLRVPSQFPRYKKFVKFKNDKLILQADEHIVNVEVTFTYDQVHISSVFLETNLKRSKLYGKPTENTSISKVLSNYGELNVVFGFQCAFSKTCLKEIFVIRGGASKTKKQNSNQVITAEKYDKIKHQKNEHPEKFWQDMNKKQAKQEIKVKEKIKSQIKNDPTIFENDIPINDVTSLGVSFTMMNNSQISTSTLNNSNRFQIPKESNDINELENDEFLESVDPDANKNNNNNNSNKQEDNQDNKKKKKSSIFTKEGGGSNKIFPIIENSQSQSQPQGFLKELVENQKIQKNNNTSSPKTIVASKFKPLQEDKKSSLNKSSDQEN